MNFSVILDMLPKIYGHISIFHFKQYAVFAIQSRYKKDSRVTCGSYKLLPVANFGFKLSVRVKVRHSANLYGWARSNPSFFRSIPDKAPT